MRHHRQVLGLFVTAVAAVIAVSAIGVAAQDANHTCNGRAATIVGTEGDDIITGTGGNDVIVGLGGHDTIAGAGGDDVICGGSGLDRINGNGGDDFLDGEKGNDRLIGGSGNDTLLGRAGGDRLFGKGGNDTLIGGTGVDRIAGNAGSDKCTVDMDDMRVSLCRGNYQLVKGSGDQVAAIDLPSSFSVLRYCWDFIDRCDDYYVARVELDGRQNFDSLGIRAFDADGEHLASYGVAGDRFEGIFMFAGEPALLEVDSGGGNWTVRFGDRAGVRTVGSDFSGSGNTVFFMPAAAPGSTFSADWNGYGHFAVIGASASDGRDLLVNEVRFETRETPPFSAEAVAKPGVSLVQVISDAGNWSVGLSR